MSNLDIDSFTIAVIQWAEEREHEIPWNWSVNGGWETWVQIDLVAFILRLDNTADILREQPVFVNRNQKADLLLRASLPPHHQIPIEIKAQSLSNHADFVAGVERDLGKLANDRDAHYAPGVCAAMAIGFNPDDIEALQQYAPSGEPAFMTVYKTEEFAVLITVMHGAGP